jgi:uncharacterized protein YprB with RNaseH-like and TPR domain
MLRESFVLLPKVRQATEQRIWAQAPDWNAFLDQARIKGFSPSRKRGCDQRIIEAKRAVLAEDAAALASLFPRRDHWRLYQEFKHDAAFLDIETSDYPGGVTVVGIWNGNETKTFVQGFNLDRAALQKELANYKLLVTFNGASFDLPVLKRYFQLPFNQPHVDLRHVCAKLGFVGGLKSIEREMHVKRPDSIKHVTGEDAAELWRCWHATGDKDFLDMLITYNEEDCVNLKTIADRLIPELWRATRANSFPYAKNHSEMKTILVNENPRLS